MVPVWGQYDLVGRNMPIVTDIVKVDCLAIDSHGQLWSLPLLGSLLLPPDIADHVCAAASLTVQRSREGGKHIWLLDIECGSHFGRTFNSVSGHSLVEGVDESRCYFSIQKKIGKAATGVAIIGLSPPWEWGNVHGLSLLHLVGGDASSISASSAKKKKKKVCPYIDILEQE